MTSDLSPKTAVIQEIIEALWPKPTNLKKTGRHSLGLAHTLYPAMYDGSVFWGTDETNEENYPVYSFDYDATKNTWTLMDGAEPTDIEARSIDEAVECARKKLGLVFTFTYAKHFEDEPLGGISVMGGPVQDCDCWHSQAAHKYPEIYDEATSDE